MMDEAVDNFLDDGFAFDKLRLAVNLILYIFQIPVDKLAATDSTVFVCTHATKATVYISCIILYNICFKVSLL